MKPTEEDIKRWSDIAKKRSAILPFEFKLLSKKDIAVVCGNCRTSFMRPLIIGQGDPVYVCPNCQNRNYIPIDWNIIRGYGKKTY